MEYSGARHIVRSYIEGFSVNISLAKFRFLRMFFSLQYSGHTRNLIWLIGETNKYSTAEYDVPNERRLNSLMAHLKDPSQKLYALRVGFKSTALKGQ